ncbi:transcription elongation GreA/GreB family factor [Pedobacter cryoconitis]|uniref:Transcription elongation GreA/GreB family factor n=1 Tax=Pedobacter cryoconitis TaxID=188932 RepID=A0A7W9DY88_9SPHI|nr:GreA/GreB family elongation factor [Pedobacter cryoconitis]MBB5634285.1 transcription elongation GreA/GreB family factor [Pedobacter cryoconitis]MBB6272589.1 transcription elongation GreA/GreB family factor [Pedobacter cryoconitis]
MEGLKAKLYQSCMDFILQRINTAETALQQAQEASNDDTKSSAGDKFETTREMMQQDIARNKNLLLDANQNLQLLTSLEETVPGDVVRNGALVYTSNGIFYISISAGQLKVDEQLVFAISAVSPIGQLLIGKKEGESFSFNKNEYTIKKIG